MFVTQPRVAKLPWNLKDGLKVIARVKDCGSDFYAITGERRVKNPIAREITENAFAQLFADSN